MSAKRGRVQFDGQVHFATWDEERTEFKLPCESQVVKARYIAYITEQAVTCPPCKRWVASTLLSR